MVLGLELGGDNIMTRQNDSAPSQSATRETNLKHSLTLTLALQALLVIRYFQQVRLLERFWNLT